MRSLMLAIGVLALFAGIAAGAFRLASHLEAESLYALGKGGLAVLGMYLGLATLMLNQVGSLDSKDALSDLGLARLRRVQRISYKRLWWIIGMIIFAATAGGLASFGGADQLAAARAVGVAIELALLSVVFVITLVYVPLLYFDLQRAREKLADMVRFDEARKKQIAALGSAEGTTAAQ